MADVNFGFQKVKRDRAKLLKKEAKARDKAAAASNARPSDEAVPESEALDPAH